MVEIVVRVRKLLVEIDIDEYENVSFVLSVEGEYKDFECGELGF